MDIIKYVIHDYFMKNMIYGGDLFGVITYAMLLGILAKD